MESAIVRCGDGFQSSPSLVKEVGRNGRSASGQSRPGSGWPARSEVVFYQTKEAIRRWL